MWPFRKKKKTKEEAQPMGCDECMCEKAAKPSIRREEQVVHTLWNLEQQLRNPGVDPDGTPLWKWPPETVVDSYVRYPSDNENTVTFTVAPFTFKFVVREDKEPFYTFNGRTAIQEIRIQTKEGPFLICRFHNRGGLLVAESGPWWDLLEVRLAQLQTAIDWEHRRRDHEYQTKRLALRYAAIEACSGEHH